MGAMTRCVALAREVVRKCKHDPMSATDAREEPSAVLNPPGVCRAACGSRWNRR